MTTRLTSSRGRPPTSSRPISSRKGAGYSSGGLTTSGGRKVLSPFEHMADSFSQFLKDDSESPEVILKNHKKNIMDLIQQSAEMISKGDKQDALLKAKEAKEESKTMQEFINTNTLDDPESKTYHHTALLTLADCYKSSSMYDDAIHVYQKLLKDRQFTQMYMVYLEIGNIYYAQKKYQDAVKNYEMGINHIHQDNTKLIARFHHSCGLAHIELRDYNKALSEFEAAMKQEPTIKTGYNLVLCHSILSSIDELKESFIRMLSVKPQSTSQLTDSDTLGNQLHIERREHIRLVMLASRLVASKDETNWQQSYEFVLNQLKKSKYPEAAGEFEVSFALAYLNHRNATKAIEMLRNIRKKDPSLMKLAATNLSYLYFLEQDYENANKHATTALEHDRYNAQALVNKGNCLMKLGQEEEARELYLEAIGVEADCIEALYNFGIVSKMIGSYDEALQVFDKLNNIIPNSPEVAFEISDCYEKTGMVVESIECLHRLFNVLPTDPAIWKRLGAIWDRDGTDTQAFHCYFESYKYCPSDLEVITWLGTYNRKQEHYETALHLFERASELAPKEANYIMMIASCYKSMDMLKEALSAYEKAYQIDNTNQQCLEQLIKLTGDMRLNDKMEHYQGLLNELLERMDEMEQEDAGNENNLGLNEMRFSLEDMDNPNNLTIGGGIGMNGLGNSLGANNKMKFNNKEKVEIPNLNISGENYQVQNVVAGNGNEDIWEGVDVDLSD
ncbi:TPR Domain containing protein [Histomonas meleagridis]|uniref:TPR Domain containing protein n=1 Tax=Histomonas meleagridis TaxID=135588 RepID=UPI00355A68DE|nr:TPR Domain containing protein [Histomonas meleagridis]KAH0802183.1 TPR Domain containing protein [Histomonas meleagridis]